MIEAYTEGPNDDQWTFSTFLWGNRHDNAITITLMHTAELYNVYYYNLTL